MRRDPSLDTLLDLDGQIIVLDLEGHYWVRFVVQRVQASSARPHGLQYSLTLHGRNGERLLGFDNAHRVRRVAKKTGEAFDHQHKFDTVRAYQYRDAVSLIADFWTAVDEVLRIRGIVL